MIPGAVEGPLRVICRLPRVVTIAILSAGPMGHNPRRSRRVTVPSGDTCQTGTETWPIRWRTQSDWQWTVRGVHRCGYF
jgi:hypothetical protein